MDQLFSYKIFITLAETKSFTNTASKLFVSQPSISRIILQLEKHLKTKLFIRSTKNIELTQEGELLYQQIKPIYHEIGVIEAAISKKKTQPTGVIRIKCPIFLSNTFYPILGEFLKDYPHINLILSIGNSPEKIDPEQTDISVLISTYGLNEKTRKTLIKIGSRQLLFLASPEYLKRKGTPKHPQELSSHEGLTFTPHNIHETWNYTEGKTSKAIKIHGRVMSTSMIPIKDMLLQGLGIAYLPEYYVKEELKNGTLVEILKDYKPKPELIHLLPTPSSLISTNLKLLITFLEKRVPKVLGPLL